MKDLAWLSGRPAPRPERQSADLDAWRSFTRKRRSFKRGERALTRSEQAPKRNEQADKSDDTSVRGRGRTFTRRSPRFPRGERTLPGDGQEVQEPRAGLTWVRACLQPGRGGLLGAGRRPRSGGSSFTSRGPSFTRGGSPFTSRGLSFKNAGTRGERPSRRLDNPGLSLLRVNPHRMSDGPTSQRIATLNG